MYKCVVVTCDTYIRASSAPVSPRARPSTGLTSGSESPADDAGLPCPGLGGDEFFPALLRLFEAVLINGLGPLLPSSKRMLIIFSTLITWLMRN